MSWSISKTSVPSCWVYLQNLLGEGASQLSQLGSNGGGLIVSYLKSALMRRLIVSYLKLAVTGRLIVSYPPDTDCSGDSETHLREA